MKWHEPEADRVFERYLTGQLSDAERDEFEQHFFDCERCFQELETMRIARDVLRTLPPPNIATPRRGPWGWIFAATAAVLVIAIAVLVLEVRDSNRAPGPRTVAAN